jgi:hypothetical protein
MFEPRLDESEVGDVTMLVLDFVGASLWQYSCIKKAARQPMTGPLAALLQWASQPSVGNSCNVFKDTFPADTDILGVLPEQLRALDGEQLQTIRGISASDAPIQFIHALAGTGKTSVLKCLLHGWNRIRGPDTFVVVALRTRELREEMWRDLLEIMPEDNLMTVGQPPAPPAGSIEPPVHDEPTQRFTKMVLSNLAMDMETLNLAKQALVAALENLSRCVERLHAPNGWVCFPVQNILRPVLKELVHLTDLYRSAGAKACRAQWALFRKWDNAAKEAVAKVAVLVCTADVAMKSFAGDVLYPANLLFRHCTCKGLWDDEAQRLPLATVAAHAAHVPCLGLSGDQGQRVSLHEELAGWAAGRSGQVSEQLTQWADQFLLQERRAPPPPRAPDDQSERIAPLHLNTVALWRLTCCNRFGDPLLSFKQTLIAEVGQ